MFGLGPFSETLTYVTESGMSAKIHIEILLLKYSKQLSMLFVLYDSEGTRCEQENRD